jgi:hypothetical protein
MLAACARPPESLLPLPAMNPPGMTAEQGVDLATDASGRVGELKQNRIDFVARYYRMPQSRWPALSPGEAQLLSANGLKIVAIWESHSRKAAHFSYSSGYDDALSAHGQAKMVGQPPGSAIYFAVDFDARRLDPIVAYFRGIAAGLAAAGGGRAQYAIGAYGSGAVCDMLKRAGLARYAWLSSSTAWKNSIGYQDWDIRQGNRLPQLTFNHDSNQARKEYGAFRLAVAGIDTTGSPAPRGLTAEQAAPTGPPPEPMAFASR